MCCAAQVRFRCDPLINFKLKQRLVLLGACVTLGTVACLPRRALCYAQRASS